MAVQRRYAPPSGIVRARKSRPGDINYVKPQVVFKRLHSAFTRSGKVFVKTLLTGYNPTLHAEATLKAVLHKANGEVIDYGIVSRNLVTTAFRDAIVGALANGGAYAAFNDFNFHDSGTDNTAEANSQTTLDTPTGIARAAGTQVDAAPIYRSVATITYDTSETIQEHGIFNASSGGTMMDRSVFTGIPVDDQDQITFTYEITFSAES